MKYKVKFNRIGMCIIGLICIFILISCNHTPSPSPSIDLPDADKKSQEVAKKAKETRKNVKNSASNINKANLDLKTQKSSIENKSSYESKKIIKPHLKKMEKDINTIGTEVNNLHHAAKSLGTINVMLNSLDQMTDKILNVIQKKENIIKRQNAQIDKLNEESNRKLKRNMRWMITIGAVIIAISLAIVFTGNPKAIAGAVIGGLLVGIGFGIMTLTNYMWMFGIFIGVGLLVILGVVIYVVYDYTTSEKSLEDIIKTVEESKEVMDEETKERIFGSDTKKKGGIADKHEDNKTKNKIEKVKKRIKKKELKNKS